MLDKEEMTSGQKQGSYHAYDEKIRAKIAKLPEENGLSSAVDLASKEVGHPVKKSAVQSIRNVASIFLLRGWIHKLWPNCH